MTISKFCAAKITVATTNRMMTAANFIDIGPCTALQPAMTDQAMVKLPGGPSLSNMLVRPFSRGLKVNCR